MKYLKLSIFTLFVMLFCFQVFAKKVMFVRTSAPDNVLVVAELQKELAKLKYEFDLLEYSATDEYKLFTDKVASVKPNLLIVLDNKAVDWAKKYNEESATKISGIALMALNLKASLNGNKNISGIAYETPAYSLATQFANAVEGKVTDVVVFYRKSLFQDRINEAQTQLKVAKMNLEAIDVEADVMGGLEKNLQKLASEKKEGRVVWVMLDSAILNKESLTKIWMPWSSSSKIPLITETKNLASPNLNFCVFATTPNLAQLANQASQMTRFILENGVKPVDIGVENLISVEAYLNEKKSDDLGLKLKESAKLTVKILN